MGLGGAGWDIPPREAMFVLALCLSALCISSTGIFLYNKLSAIVSVFLESGCGCKHHCLIASQNVFLRIPRLCRYIFFEGFL